MTAEQDNIQSHKSLEYTSYTLKIRKLLQYLGVKNELFIFKTKEQLIKEMALVYSHMASFGLEIHIGRQKNGKLRASKTKYVFSPFPPPSVVLKS